MKTKKILTFASFTLFTFPVLATNPYALEEGSWISINGTVTSVSADEFELVWGWKYHSRNG